VKLFDKGGFIVRQVKVRHAIDMGSLMAFMKLIERHRAVRGSTGRRSGQWHRRIGRPRSPPGDPLVRGATATSLAQRCAGGACGPRGRAAVQWWR
jgi:hypothetical protein